MFQELGRLTQGLSTTYADDEVARRWPLAPTLHARPAPDDEAPTAVKLVDGARAGHPVLRFKRPAGAS